VKRPLTNVAASVRQRLLNLAIQRGEEFQSILVRFANERLIYRLAVSPYAGDFVLKGAMLLYAWSAFPFRATQDVDLLGRGEITAESLSSVFREICEAKVADDGLDFQARTVRVGLIREAQEYGGFRVKLQARLTAAKVELQVDVGIGDASSDADRLPHAARFPGAQAARLFARGVGGRKAARDGGSRFREQPDEGLLRRLGPLP
jgi:hypothetical protein